MHQIPLSDQYTNLIDNAFGSQDFNSLSFSTFSISPYRSWVLPPQDRQQPAMTSNAFTHSPGFIPQNMISQSANGVPIDFLGNNNTHNQSVRPNYSPSQNFMSSQNVGPQNSGNALQKSQNFGSPRQQNSGQTIQMSTNFADNDIHSQRIDIGPINFLSPQLSQHIPSNSPPNLAFQTKLQPSTNDPRTLNDLLNGGMFDSLEPIESHINSEVFNELESAEPSPVSISPRLTSAGKNQNGNQGKRNTVAKGKTPAPNPIPGSKVAKTQTNAKTQTIVPGAQPAYTSGAGQLGKNSKPHTPQPFVSIPKATKPAKTAPAPEPQPEPESDSPQNRPFSWADVARSTAAKTEQTQVAVTTITPFPIISVSSSTKGPSNSPQEVTESEPILTQTQTQTPQGKPRRRKGPIPALECLTDINPINFPCNPKFAKFFVIKSYSEDDVHKSIKYSIWTSTETGNKRLDKAYRECSSKGPIYLFFSVNSSGQFCGFAEMTSPLDYSKKAECWNEDKWSGQFSVKWRSIKDIPNNQLRHIRLTNNENKPVTNSRDTQEVLYQPGCELLKQFINYASKSSILDDFAYYNEQEDKEKKARELAQKSKQLD